MSEKTLQEKLADAYMDADNKASELSVAIFNLESGFEKAMGCMNHQMSILKKDLTEKRTAYMNAFDKDQESKETGDE